jgi:hypothetical protein
VSPKDMLSVAIGVTAAMGYAPYVVAILRGRAKPAKATWAIWALLDSIALAGMYAEDAVNAQIVIALLGAMAITALGLKYGRGGWTALDRVCLGGAVLAIVLWKAYDSPVLGIMTSLSGVLIGALPTFVSAWKDPSKEDRTAWTLFFVSGLLAVVAIPSWTLQDAAQPLIFFVVNATVALFVYVRPRFV